MALTVHLCPECGAHLAVRHHEPGAVIRCGNCDREVSIGGAVRSVAGTIDPEPLVSGPRLSGTRVSGLLRALPVILTAVAVLHVVLVPIVLLAIRPPIDITFAPAILIGTLIDVVILLGLAQAVRLLLRLEADRSGVGNS